MYCRPYIGTQDFYRHIWFLLKTKMRDIVTRSYFAPNGEKQPGNNREKGTHSGGTEPNFALAVSSVCLRWITKSPSNQHDLESLSESRQFGSQIWHSNRFLAPSKFHRASCSISLPCMEVFNQLQSVCIGRMNLSKNLVVIDDTVATVLRHNRFVFLM